MACKSSKALSTVLKMACKPVQAHFLPSSTSCNVCQFLRSCNPVLTSRPLCWRLPLPGAASSPTPGWYDLLSHFHQVSRGQWAFSRCPACALALLPCLIVHSTGHPSPHSQSELYQGRRAVFSLLPVQHPQKHLGYVRCSIATCWMKSCLEVQAWVAHWPAPMSSLYG